MTTVPQSERDGNDRLLSPEELRLRDLTPYYGFLNRDGSVQAAMVALRSALLPLLQQGIRWGACPEADSLVGAVATWLKLPGTGPSPLVQALMDHYAAEGMRVTAVQAEMMLASNVGPLGTFVLGGQDTPTGVRDLRWSLDWSVDIGATTPQLIPNQFTATQISAAGPAGEVYRYQRNDGVTFVVYERRPAIISKSGNRFPYEPTRDRKDAPRAWVNRLPKAERADALRQIRTLEKVPALAAGWSLREAPQRSHADSRDLFAWRVYCAAFLELSWATIARLEQKALRVPDWEHIDPDTVQKTVQPFASKYEIPLPERKRGRPPLRRTNN